MRGVSTEVRGRRFAVFHAQGDNDQRAGNLCVRGESERSIKQRASRVQVDVERRPDGYLISVRDDGQGFDPQGPRDPKSLGLVGLQERAQMLGGQLEVRGGRGTGATIVVSFPAAPRMKERRLVGVGEA